jgi:hypothetical protein
VGKISVRSLTIAAGIVLLALAITSDLTPVQVVGFQDATGGDPATVDCIVVQCNRSKTGIIINAVDQNGGRASIYFQPSVLQELLPAGSAIKVAVTPSDDDPTFLFASSIEVLTHPGTTARKTQS